MQTVGDECLVEVDTIVRQEVSSVASDLGTWKESVQTNVECGRMHTALQIHGIETEKNFVVGHDIGLLLNLAVWSLRMPCPESDIIVLGRCSASRQKWGS